MMLRPAQDESRGIEHAGQCRRQAHHAYRGRAVDGKPEALHWDRDLPGFGVRVYRTGRKVYIVQARGPAGSKRAVIGRHGELRADAARREAVVMIDRIKRGEDPVPRAPAREPTVADLAQRYVTAHLEVNCRPGTVETFGRVVRLYIVPELGHLRFSEVDRSHVSALHYRMRDKPYQANQTVSVLGKMFQLAEAWGMTAPRRNPCRSVRHYKEHRRERFLMPEEYRRLGRVLDEAAADGSVFPTAVPAIRLLLLTGCRKNEIVTLRWDDIDRTAGVLRLRDSKTGARRVGGAAQAFPPRCAFVVRKSSRWRADINLIARTCAVRGS